MDVHLDGRWLPAGKVRTSPLNSALFFGETVFEAVPLYGGKPLFLSRHLRRLEKGCRFLGWRPLGHRKIAGVLAGFTERWGGAGNFLVRIGLWQDLGPSAGPRIFPSGRPRLLANARPLRHDPASPTPALGRVGLARWRVPSRLSHPFGFKTALYLTARREMRRHPEWDEMLRLGEDGSVADGYASTPLLVRKGRILAAPADRMGLEGVTFSRILSLGKRLGFRVVRRPWRIAEAEGRDCELIFVGSGVGVLSTASFQGRSFKAPGPVACRLWEGYRRWIREL